MSKDVFPFGTLFARFEYPSVQTMAVPRRGMSIKYAARLSMGQLVSLGISGVQLPHRLALGTPRPARLLVFGGLRRQLLHPAKGGTCWLWTTHFRRYGFLLAPLDHNMDNKQWVSSLRFPLLDQPEKKTGSHFQNRNKFGGSGISGNYSWGVHAVPLGFKLAEGKTARSVRKKRILE